MVKAPSSSNLAVIPARGGSKRIPRKNLRSLCGRPLVAYTIQAALNSHLFAKVVLSTDCPELALIGRQLGADVPFLREANLADDHTPTSLVTLDVLQRLDPNGSLFGNVAQLMPNCPMRTSQDIAASFRQFVETGACSQISVTRYGWLNPWWAMTLNEAHQLEPLFPEQLKRRSQDLPVAYTPTGAIWWAKIETLRKEKTFYTSDRRGWEIGWQSAVDIDDEDDWDLAELLMTQRSRAA